MKKIKEETPDGGFSTDGMVRYAGLHIKYKGDTDFQPTYKSLNEYAAI